MKSDEQYDTSNVINQHLDNTNLNTEIDILLQTLNKVFIGTEIIEKINSLNTSSIKQLFNSEKWEQEKNIDFMVSVIFFFQYMFIYLFILHL